VEDPEVSQLAIVYDERVTNFVTSSASYIDATGPLLAAGSFEVGRKYLLLARAEVHRSIANGSVGGARLMHGATAFDGGEMLFVGFGTSSEINNKQFWYMTVWTAAAEDIKIQLKGDGTDNTGLRWGTLLAIPLGADVGLTENTHWFFNEVTADSTLITGGTNGGALTWTPGTAGQKWLILSHAALETDTAGVDSYVSRLDRTGEATASWDLSMPGGATGLASHYPHMWVGTLGAVSQTWKEISRRVGTTAATANRRRSAIFALNLTPFDVNASDFTDTKADLVDTPDYGQQLATVAPTQLVNNGAALVLGAITFETASGDNGQRYWYGRAQVDNSDALSGYTAAGYRFSFHSANVPSQMVGYLFASVRTSVASGAHSADLDASVVLAAAGRGAKFRRLLYLSLDVSPPAPPAGGGGTAPFDRNEQIMYQNDYDSTRRTVIVGPLRDATDHISPETGEAAGQPQISKNGAAFANSSATLVALDATSGLYKLVLTQAELDTLGYLTVKYKSANTDYWTYTLAVQELPWLWAGAIASATSSSFTLGGTPPTFIPPGSIIDVVAGTGAGQSALVQSYANPTGQLETGYTWQTTLDATSRIVIKPGLPLVVPDANVASINKSASAAVGLQEGAEAISTFTIQTGANSATSLVTNLPITVNGTTTPPNFWAGRGVTGKTGATAGDLGVITASVVSGANTILTLDPGTPLSQTPAVGTKFVVT
jgi:hypothetical protein